MKTPIIRLGNIGLVIGAIIVAGCNASSADSNTVAADPLAFQPAPTIAQVPPAPGEPAAMPLPSAEPKLDFTPSSNLTEMIKLARAGVSESLMLSFIRNTPGDFRLGAREIIYLADLGVSENIINTMMERDRTITNVPQPAAVAEVAPAPAVVEQPPVVVTEPAPVTVNYFYETLSPYGTWIEVDGYGRCWQPTVVVYQTDWQPYCDRGRWVYTDCGWYWASDYSWGNVAFHYGRWFRHPHRGWCWSPDTVWGPAWVSWRRDNDYCGWAPLPPAACYRPGIGFFYQDRHVGIGFEFGLGADCYTFVSRHHFTDSRLRNHRAPRHEVTQIFNHTTVNNHYSGGRDGHVFNHGIEPSAITAGTPNQIRPVRAPAPAAPANRINPADRSHDRGFGIGGDRDRNDRGNSSGRGHDSSPRPSNPVATQPAPVVTPPNLPNPNDRGHGIGNSQDHGNSSPGNRESGSRNPAPTKPAQIITPETPRPTPAPVAPPTITPPGNRSTPPADRSSGTGNGRDHGNSSSRDRDSGTRSYSPAPTKPALVVPPSTPRPAPTPAPAPVITPPQIRTPVATPPPVNIAPPTRSVPTDRGSGISTGRDHGNSSGWNRDSSTRSLNPVQTRPSPVVAPPTVPSQERSRYQAPAPAPQPSFTPRSTPAPSSPRIESHPASAAPAPAPAPARSESRSGSDTDKRGR